MANETNELFEGLEALVSGKINPVQTTEKKDSSDNSENNEPKAPTGFTQEELDQPVNTGEEKEETEKPDPTKTPVENPDEIKDNKEDADLYKGISGYFKEKGLVTEDFDSADSMMKVFQKEREDDIKAYKDELPEVIKELIENFEEGVPLEDLIKTKSTEIVLSNIDEDSLKEDVDLQKNLYREYLKKTTKFSDAKIDKEIKTAEDLGTLPENAKEGLDSLKTLNKEREELVKTTAKKQAIEDTKKQQEEVQAINKTVMELKEIIPGIKLTEKEQKELFKNLTTVAEIRGDIALSKAALLREKNPVDFEIKLNYFIQKGFFDGNFGEILNKVKTTTTREFEKSIEDNAKKLLAKTTGAPASAGESDFLEAWKNRSKK